MGLWQRTSQDRSRASSRRRTRPGREVCEEDEETSERKRMRAEVEVTRRRSVIVKGEEEKN